MANSIAKSIKRGIVGNNVELVKYNIMNLTTTFEVYNSSIKFDRLLKQAIEDDPRLIVFIKGYSYSYSKKSHLSPVMNLTITMQYNDNIPSDINLITVDDGASSYIDASSYTPPNAAFFVTKDVNSLFSRMTTEFNKMNYEGLGNISNQTYSFPDISEYSAVYIDFGYYIDKQILDQKIKQAQYKANIIAKDLTKGVNVPPFVKAFLALSYLQQTTIYDHRSYNAIEKDPQYPQTDIAPFISYGPLCEQRGICSGLAYAYKTLMESMNINCIFVKGYVDHNYDLGHAWCMIMLNNQYYHVDPTKGIDSYVCVQSFLKDSNKMNEYEWEYDNYPQANGRFFDYEKVEEWLIDHGDDLIDAGVEEKYVFPESVYD